MQESPVAALNVFCMSLTGSTDIKFIVLNMLILILSCILTTHQIVTLPAPGYM